MISKQRDTCPNSETGSHIRIVKENQKNKVKQKEASKKKKIGGEGE